MKDKLIGVLMGGFGGEREVSLRSGSAVMDALGRRNYKCVAVDVGDDLIERLRAERVEVAFIALHGAIGEDGIVQGALEFLRIPYTGSGVLSSAISMDKITTKRIFESIGIPTAQWEVIDPKGSRMPEKITPPLVIKPASGGSSLAVSIIPDDEGDRIKKAVDLALEVDNRVIVEKYIPGAEITVGVLDGEALGCVEIRPKEGFYDYRNKYTAGGAEYIAPAPINENTTELIRHLGVTVYEALCCRGAARVDFRLPPQGGPVVLELNTIPGLTSTSLLPKSAKAVGMDFDTLIEKMLAGAVYDRKQ